MRSTIWKKTLICLGAVLFLESPAVSPAFAYTVKAENTDAEAATSNIKSILLIGQDKREGESRQRSDSMILATLDKDQGTVSLTSFMRDLYVAIPGYSTTRINAAYAYGGMDLLDATLEENFGVKIDGNVEVDFEVFQVLVDKVGGIDLELTQAEADYICGRDQSVLYPQPLRSDWNLQEGMNHLDGVQAVAYGRLRLMDTDYARTERQRIILQKAFDKAKNADWATLNCLIQTIMPQLATNVDITDLIPLARNIAKFHIGETAGFPAARGEQDVGKIGDCVIPQTLEYNVKELHKFLFDEEDYQVPSNVKEYSSHIAQVTGLTTNAKLIGHVPVDQGVSAQTFIKKRASRIAAQAAAKDAAKKSSTSASDESDDESGDETKKGESESSIGLDEIFDPDEDWIDWEEEESKSNSSKGPGTTTTPGKKNHTDKTTEADDSLSGPGSTSETKSSVAKPGSTTTTAAETAASSEKTSPGASDNSGVKSPVTEIQDPGNSGNSDAAGPGGPAGPGA